MLKSILLWWLACSLAYASTTMNNGRLINPRQNLTIMQCDDKIRVYSICSEQSNNSNISSCITYDPINKEMYTNVADNSIKNVIIFAALKEVNVNECIVASNKLVTFDDVKFVDNLKSSDLSLLVREVRYMNVTIEQLKKANH